jgi:phospholipase D1/2
MEAAEREILIVGWDIDSAVELIRDESHPLFPSPLAETLQSLAERKPSLEVRVLSWDFAMVYVLERELLPAYRFGWQDSNQLHFHLDGEHAHGASHHQKFVVIDGELAFIGGIDLTKSRWDSREHAADDPRRVNSDGEIYRPFHDVQAKPHSSYENSARSAGKTRPAKRYHTSARRTATRQLQPGRRACLPGPAMH